MRISKGALLVVLALTIPLIVELRTMLVWVGIELSVLESATIGAIMIGVILLWAFLPKGSDGANGNVSNGN